MPWVEEEQGTYFFMILMKPGISRLNTVSVFVICFMSSFIIFLRTGLTPYLILYDYGKSQHDSVSLAARLGWMTDIALIPSEFLLGLLNDIFGRKKLIVAGMFLCGTLLICETLFSKFWPWLTILYISMGIAYLPILLCPL